MGLFLLLLSSIPYFFLDSFFFVSLCSCPSFCLPVSVYFSLSLSLYASFFLYFLFLLSSFLSVFILSLYLIIYSFLFLFLFSIYFLFLLSFALSFLFSLAPSLYIFSSSFHSHALSLILFLSVCFLFPGYWVFTWLMFFMAFSVPSGECRIVHLQLK